MVFILRNWWKICYYKSYYFYFFTLGEYIFKTLHSFCKIVKEVFTNVCKYVTEYDKDKNSKR